MTSWLWLAACRPDLGRPEYPEFPAWTDTGDPFLPGPFPFRPGDERLSIGVFYEGESTESVPIDDTVTHYYVYSGTYTQTVTDDRIEGLRADVIVLASQPWWGGGVTWDSPRDLSAWTTLHASFKAADPVFDAFEVGITGGGEVRLPASGYGFVADGAWHSLVVPLADFTAGGCDLSQVTLALMLISDTAAESAELSVDDVYFSKE
jgi:hypothetical protein